MSVIVNTELVLLACGFGIGLLLIIWMTWRLYQNTNPGYITKRR